MPAPINPKEYPALEDLRLHCRRGGQALIDRAYADALKLHQRLKEAEDLAGLTEPAPKPRQNYAAYAERQDQLRDKDEEML